MKLKVTKNLTYPEARKLYDQQQPEFTFTKVVQSLSAKLETKTAYTQYNVEDSKIPESSKAIVAQKQKPSSQSTSSSTTSAQPQAGSQNRANSSSNKPSSGQANAQKQTNRPSTNTKPTNDKHTSNRQSKGSNDAVKLHNKFGVLWRLMTWILKRLQRAHAHLTLAPFPQSIVHSFQSSLTSNQKV